MSRPSFPRPIKYGTVFHTDTGKLYLFHPEEDIQVMRAWEKPRAWQYTMEKGWRGFHPILDIPRGSVEKRLARIAEQLKPPAPSPGDPPRLVPETLGPVNLPSLLREQARLNWIRTIPEEIRLAIRTFPKHQWHLLRMVGTAKAPTLDLIRSTPALALALACAPRFHPIQRPTRAWRSLLGPGHSQTDVAAWLGFPGTRATIRLLRKVDAKCLSSSALIYLRTIASDPRLQKRSAHLPNLTRTCIFLLSNPTLEPLIGQRLLHEAAENPNLRVSRNLLDILRMLEALHPKGQRIVPFTTSDQVLEMHHDLVGQMQAIELADLPLPPPPVAGTEAIIPITTVEDLAEEGRHQKNCVASYLRDIHRGRVFVYRMLWPERATVSLRVIGRETLHWVIDQVFLAQNQDPSPVTLHAVRTWFAASNCAPPKGQISAEPEVIEGFGDDIPF